jgi:hypothetical protein
MLGSPDRRLLEGSYGDAQSPVVKPPLEWLFYDDEEQRDQAYLKLVSGDVTPIGDKVAAGKEAVHEDGPPQDE